MKKIELLELITDSAKRYRLNCVDSVNRNSHMNELCGHLVISQVVVDSILTDFINHVGVEQGVDYALYTKDLEK